MCVWCGASLTCTMALWHYRNCLHAEICAKAIVSNDFWRGCKCVSANELQLYIAEVKRSLKVCTAYCIVVMPFSQLSLLQCIWMVETTPYNSPFPWGDLHPHLKHCSLNQPESSAKTESWSDQLSLCSWLYWSILSLYFTIRRDMSSRNCPFPWRDPGPHLIHESFGPPETTTSSAIFAGLTLVSNRHTQKDRPHYIDSNRMHLMFCISMWPNNTSAKSIKWKLLECY